MTHGIKPIPPFDITLATFPVPDLNKPLSTADPIAACTCQLEQRPEDLEHIHGRESVLGRKIEPCHFGPTVVIWRTRNGAYRLAELDGAASHCTITCRDSLH
jgi:hypothetical protein